MQLGWPTPIVIEVGELNPKSSRFEYHHLYSDGLVNKPFIEVFPVQSDRAGKETD